MNSLVPLPVVVPLAAAALLLMFGGVLAGSVVRALTVAATIAETVLAGALVHAARSGTIVYWFGGWTPRHGAAIGVSFAVDRIGAGAATLAGVVVTAAALSTRRAFGERPALTHALMLTMLAAMAGFCLTGDIFDLFVFYELIAVSAFGLAAFDTGDPRSLRAALNFAITNSIGAFLLLIGIALLYGRTGALNLAQIGRQLAAAPHTDGLVVVAFATITVGFLVKAAIVPFHFWLVDLASTGPVPLVLILGGALDALAVYAIARVYWTAFAPALGGHEAALRVVLLAVGAFTALIAGAMSLSTREPRRVLAFVLVSHTGTVLVGVGCLSALGIAGTAIYALADGAIKVALFACIGMRTGDREEVVSGVAVTAVLIAGGLALAGFPLFGISLGESVIEHAASSTGNPWIVPVLVVASVLTAGAVLRIALTAARTRGARPRAPELGAVAGVLVGVAIGARFAAARWAAGAASAFVASNAYGRAVLNGERVASPAAAGGVRLSGGSELLDLVTVVGALAIVVWLDWVRPRATARSAMRETTAVGYAIRRLHSGSLGDSVTWLTVGATTFAVAVAVALR